MSRFFTLCQANNKKHGLKDQAMEFKPARRCVSFNYYISIFLLCLIFSLSCFYIFNITSHSTTGFKFSEYEEKIEELKLVQQNLKEQARTYENLDYLRQRSDSLGLAQVAEVDYLEIEHSGVALR